MKMSVRFSGLLAGVLALASFAGPASAQVPTVADVGDPDSFGHNVTYLGKMQSIPLKVEDPCQIEDPTKLRCTSMLHDGADTIINETDLGVIRLPARATKTLLCFLYVPFVVTEYSNAPSPQFAKFSIAADVTIENSVLNDPTLVNPLTGQPFGGKIKVSQSTLYELRGIVAGQYEVRQELDSLFCAGGVSRRQLIDLYKLTPAQATAFFARPITLRFGAKGQINEGFLNYHYNFRVFGDN